MRVTNNQIGRTLLYNLETSWRRMEAAQTQLATGRRLQLPQDDPTGTAAALQLRRTRAEDDRYLSNTDDGLAWLQATDSALDHIMSAVNRAREIAVNGANTTYPQQSLDTMAAEIDQLLAGAVRIGNTTHDGRYIFAGMKTTTQPFTQVGSTVTYNGDSNQISREISAVEQVVVNVPGDVLLPATPPPPAVPPPDIFTTLAGLAADLRAGNQGNISSTRITDLDTHIDQLLAARAEVGAKTNRFERNADVLRDSELTSKALLSKIEDADIAKVVIELKLAENAHSSALATGARIVPQTLVDFLR